MNTEHSRRSFFKKAGMGGAAGMALFTSFGAGIEQAVASQSLASSASALRITRISTAFATRSQRRMFVKVETNQGSRDTVKAPTRSSAGTISPRSWVKC